MRYTRESCHDMESAPLCFPATAVQAHQEAGDWVSLLPATDMYGRTWQGRKERIKQELERKVIERHLGKRVRRFRVRKKVIRVESEETQDYVTECLNLSRE